MALDFLAGCIGGCAGVLVGHPFDTVKVRLQIQSKTNPVYKGTLDCFVSIVKKESVFGLYKGITSPLYGLGLINAIVFGVQANLQRRLPNSDSLWSHFNSGTLAGFAQSVVCSPMELAKTRMQIQGQGQNRYQIMQPKIYKGPMDCLIKVYRAEGWHGVFRGFWLTAVRDSPSFGVYFATFEYICQLSQSEDSKYVSTPVLLLAGGLGGVTSWISTYPFDVIKSRFQADRSNKYKSVWDCMIKSYQTEGLGIFVKGLSPTLIRAFPMNAATFVAVAWTLRLGTSHPEWLGPEEHHYHLQDPRMAASYFDEMFHHEH